MNKKTKKNAFPGSQDLGVKAGGCEYVRIPIYLHVFWIHTVQLRRFFKTPPQTGWVDFLAHRGSSWYPTPIPAVTDFSSTAFPLSSLRKTTHLPIVLRGGQKFYPGELAMKD